MPTNPCFVPVERFDFAKVSEVARRHEKSDLLVNTDGVVMSKRGRGGERAMLGPSMTRTLDGTEGQGAPKLHAPTSPLAIRVERKGSEPLFIRLYPDQTYSFGRSAEATVVCPGDAVSRLHAQLRFVDDHWRIRDLNSSNGTFLIQTDARKGDPRVGAERHWLNEQTVGPGQTLVLGNGDSQVHFVAEMPAEQVKAETGKTSVAAKRLDRAIAVAATHRLPVFLLGASGVGKTHVARSIHERSLVQGQFVLLNCGRLPTDPAQLTSELLGHVQGAFTGAVTSRTGRLFSADGGTLFLDEVESLSKVAQDFLLDVLEGSGNFAPYGAANDARRTAPHFRLISASKAGLSRSGLRPDLCQRLAAGELVTLPTLAERVDDIPGLVAAFLRQMRLEQRINADISEEGMSYLQNAAWPGEIRELESTVKVVVNRTHASRLIDGLEGSRFMVKLADIQEYISQRHLGFASAAEQPTKQTNAVQQPLPAHARKRPADISLGEITEALREHGGNKTRAAASLGIAINTLKTRLKGSE